MKGTVWKFGDDIDTDINLSDLYERKVWKHSRKKSEL